jgi:hypothetical protein
MSISPRREVYSEDLKVEQKAPIIGDDNTDEQRRTIIKADPASLSKEYLEELAFNEEPVTIRLDPSTDQNAAKMVFVSVNGKGCEVFMNNRWIEWKWIPIGQVLIIKRKYLEVLIGAKQDKITTDYGSPGDENPINRVNRFTSSYQSFQVIEDKNPRGMAWLTELRRRAL